MKKFLQLCLKLFVYTICLYNGFCCMARADTETITWYVDDSVYDTTTCQSGGDVILPTAPTSPYGYTFHGWEALYDMSTLNVYIDGDEHYAIVDTGQCWYRTGSMQYNSQQNCTNDNYADLTTGQWKTQFSYGTVYGTSKCSTTTGVTPGKTGNPVDTVGVRCWCKFTGFVPSGVDALYLVASLWVFHSERASTSVCVSNCANYCSDGVQSYLNIRSGLFDSQVS